MEESTEKFYKFYDRDDEEIYIRPSAINVIEVRRSGKILVFTDCHVVEVPHDKNIEEIEKLVNDVSR
jgi:phosphotransacetylase